MNQLIVQQIVDQKNASEKLAQLYLINQPFDSDQFKNIKPRQLIKRDQNRFLIKRLIITPSAFIFKEPFFEQGNRVLQHSYSYDPDAFLKIQFSNEDQQMTKAGNVQTSEIKQILTDFQLFGKVFEFLGFSNSQLKSQQCWMYARNKDLNAQMIRDSMGIFSNIKNPSKYAARLGLCFTTTTKSLQLLPGILQKENDIERNGYVFTDGVGKIGEYAFSLIQEFTYKHFLQENESQLRDDTSAVQIRLGGCKGILVLDPNIHQEAVIIRPSMEKFQSYHNTVEVCRFAYYNKARLNRQIILLLNGLGVDEKVFQELMDRDIQNLIDSFNDTSKAISQLALINWLTFGNLAVPIRLLRLGQNPQNNKFIYSILEKLFQYRKEKLYNNQQFKSPKSALLVGAIDEYNLLEPNECFIQKLVNTQEGQKQKIILGKVVVTKNPCFHPGDIRVLDAVDYPQLHHLKNLVIFSQKGDRPVPDMISGSDLDGDEYFVSWYPQLIPTQQNYTPMKSVKIQERSVENVQINHIIDLFISNMQSSNLGLIANTQLIWGDLCGIFSKKFLKLAELQSIAVDFPKTGYQEKLPQKYQLPQYPNFLKQGNNTYTSEGILGKLYVQALNYQFPCFDNKAQCDTESPLFQFSQNVFNYYKNLIDCTLDQQNLKDDIELILCKAIRTERSIQAFSSNKNYFKQIADSIVTEFDINSQRKAELQPCFYYIGATSRHYCGFCHILDYVNEN